MVPLSVEDLARDAAAGVAKVARAFTFTTEFGGSERLGTDLVAQAVTKVRDACGVPVGVSIGAWIEPDQKRRLGLVRAWRVPDHAPVNLSEPGAAEIMGAFIRAGVGLEAGVWTVEDVRRLAASGLGGRVTRILVEPLQVGADAAIGLAIGFTGR